MRAFRLLILSLFVTFLYAAKDVPTIVTIDWLSQNIDNKMLVLVDLRSKDEYIKGHIENSVNIPGLKSLFDESFMMPKLDFLSDLLSDAGIDHNSLVVAYDNGDFIWVARFYWILQTLGHKNVGLFKYGYGNKIEDNFTVSKDIYTTKKRVCYKGR